MAKEVTLTGTTSPLDQTPVSSPANERQPEEAPELAQATLELLATPELCFLSVALGVTALACCLALESTAWHWMPGVAFLSAGLAGLTSVPVTAAALMLLTTAVISFTFEVVAYPGMALHASGGALSLLLFGLYLTGSPPAVHPGVVAMVGLASGLAVFLAARRSPRRVREDPFASKGGVIGHRATVLHADGARGIAVVSGELWMIRARGIPLRAGQEVRVMRSRAQYLDVEPIGTRRVTSILLRRPREDR